MVSSKIITIFLLKVQIYQNQVLLVFSVTAETRDRKHIFANNSVRKKARDKSRIPNEKVDHRGPFGGLVNEV